MKSFSISQNIINKQFINECLNDFTTLQALRHYFLGLLVWEFMLARELGRALQCFYNVLLSANWQGTRFHGFWLALRCLVNGTLEASNTNLFLSGLFPSALKWLNLSWATESYVETDSILYNHRSNDNYVYFWQTVCAFLNITDIYIRYYGLYYYIS